MVLVCPPPLDLLVPYLRLRRWLEILALDQYEGLWFRAIVGQGELPVDKAEWNSLAKLVSGEKVGPIVCWNLIDTILNLPMHICMFWIVICKCECIFVWVDNCGVHIILWVMVMILWILAVMNNVMIMTLWVMRLNQPRVDYRETRLLY